MGEYVSDFGIIRHVGRGEGIDEKYNASAKPALGATNAIEVVVDGAAPQPNKGTGYGNGQAKLPAGAVIGRTVFLVEEAGSADDVKLQLVKVDGTDAQDMMDATDPTDGSVVNANKLNGVRIAEDRYVKIAGTTTTGLKGKAIIEYV